MAKKESVFKKMFSKSNKDCCSVEIEEVDLDRSDRCYDEIQKKDERNEKKHNNQTKY